MGDFLNKDIPSSNYKHNNFISYEEMAKINILNNINSITQYIKFIKGNNLNAPYHSERTYKNKWEGYNKFLGQIKKDAGRDNWFTAETAVEYGLIDKIVTKSE